VRSPRRVVLANRALRDLRRIQPREQREAIAEALDSLRAETANLDIRPLLGRAPWLRLRAGSYRILYRPLTSHEGTGFLVARIIDRRDLEEAIRRL
jgi:mRNA-degrading endonuclease RelE of RelBE toxin-antitoxin system